MPQSEAKFQINQFTLGLVTDANPLADTGPISTDEDNLEILSHGGRRRRRGARIEIGGVTNSDTVTSGQKQEFAFDGFDWDDVAGIPGLEFFVYQQGSTIYFYDKSQSPVSSGQKSFSVDLQTYRTSAATAAEVRNTRVSLSAGKGAIFVASPAIEPIIVEYNETNDSITVTEIEIKVRDFDEQSPTIGPQAEVAIPTTGRHLYDLLNQGWYQTGPYMRDGGSTNRDETPVVVLYLGHSTSENKLPRKNTPWHIGKYLVPEDSAFESNTFISPQQIRAAPSGNTLSPFGHYILNAFNKDRAQAVRDENDFTTTFMVANLDTIPTETEAERPVSVEFFAGRAWFALKNTLYFSQQLSRDSLDNVGKCYQEGDPTNEAESDIIATDGGTITIPSMGRVVAMASMTNAIIIFADNGIWSVTGSNGSGFTAIDFAVTKLSNTAMRSPSSIVEAENLILFWGKESIYVIKPGDVDAFPVLEDIAEGRITSFYSAIPSASKENVKGIYNPRDKVIHWMYKGSTDTLGTSINRFAYDKFLNFSLKFSSFYPWSVDATDTRQIMGGTLSSGLLSTIESSVITTTGGVDITNTSGEDVTINTVTQREASNLFKVLLLKDDAATFGDFTDTNFLDWNEENAGLDYSSYVNTFYHIQDDTMAFMQAPYVYVYFRKTEEDSTDNFGPFTYQNFSTGGATFNASFIGSIGYSAGPDDAPSIHPNRVVIKGLDDKRYAFATDVPGGSSAPFWDIDTELVAFTLTNTTVTDDLEAAGVVPVGGRDIIQDGDMFLFNVPDTPYIIIVRTVAAGVTTAKDIAYYRINSSSALEFVGGFATKADGLGVQFSPPESNTAYGVGIVGGPKTELPSSNPLADSHNKVAFQYPFAVAWQGEGRSTVFVMPAINDTILNPVKQESSTTVWFGRELDMSTWFTDDNIFLTQGHPGTRSDRVFFMPNSTADGGKMYQKINLRDIEQHIAGSEAVTSGYIQTHDATYPNGFIPSLEIAVAASGADPLGITFSGSSPLENAHTTAFPYFPFSDETDNFDTTAGSSADNYYCNPAVYPIYDDDITGPWIMFWPKFFRGDDENVKVAISIYNPDTHTSFLADTMQGQFIDIATDINPSSGLTIENGAVSWDRATGELTLGVRYAAAGESHYAFSTIGTFDPTVEGIASVVDTIANPSITIESGCIMNTRWDWANATSSGKISNDYQIYRGDRLHLVTDPDNPEATGLPVLVSKNKTKGRGRALQLRFTSETGKDLELYGWAVWSRKNTRF